MRIGIDLGGSKIEAIVLEETGRELFRRRTETPRHDYAQTLSAIADLVQQAEQQVGAGPLPIGIGTPGALSPATGRIKNSNSTWLIDKPLDVDLKARLQREILFANDADCFTLSEAVDGAGKNAKSVFGVILGTGVGGGIAIHKQILSGPNAICGEWGHNSLPWPDPTELPGPECYCGQNGCIETYLSGPALEAHYSEVANLRRSAIEIAKRRKEDPDAQTVLDYYAHRLARGLASVINVLDPEIIVLGGGVSNIDYLYERVPEFWELYVFSDRVDTQLARAVHGDSSGVRGAAWLGLPGLT